MIKLGPQSHANRSSIRFLKGRVDYISDPDDDNHKQKVVFPSQNHKCSGQRPLDFYFAVLRARKRYVRGRRRKPGKRTRHLWVEYIYSSPDGLIQRDNGEGMLPCLSEEERKMVERAFLSGPFGKAATRYGWHVDKKTGRCDCHFLVCAYGVEDPSIPWINNGFGHGKKQLQLALERIEEAFVAALNVKRSRELQLLTPRQVHIKNRKLAGKKTLAQKLVDHNWDGQADTLEKAVLSIGYTAKLVTPKTIIVKAPVGKNNKQKETTYVIATLKKNAELYMAEMSKQPKVLDSSIPNQVPGPTM